MIVRVVRDEEQQYPLAFTDLIMNEADEEHHVARILIAELDHTTDRNDHREAKFTVLAENVRHHIKEEESEVFPKAKGAAIDFDALNQAMLKRKEKLLAIGVPPAAEEAMVGAMHGKGDSPAQAAQRRRRMSSGRRSQRARPLIGSHR